ncbi:MAG: signal peptide peptidase SppA [Phycisphaerales bacterium]|nr:signal peptide peptidase SppA [Phycisphaerales bacterium]
MMRQRKLPFFLTVLIAFSAVPFAQAFDKDDDAKKLVEEKVEKKDEKKVDPIKKLVEVRIDPFLVAARSLNIPLPGRINTISELLERFKKYGEDDEVGAVLLNMDGLNLGLPDVEELRAGIAELRKADKKVLAFLNSGDPMGYLLACQADEVAIAPSGSLAIPGIGRVFPFLRGMYQMQGIEFDVITAGRFKYPGFVNSRGPNKYFREEFEGILDDWYEDYVKFIAEGRGLSEEKVKEIIDIAIFDAERAKNRNLVDVITYYEEYRDRILRRHKYKKARDFGSDFSKIVSLNDLLNAWQKQVKQAQKRYTEVGPKIAVLHARGPIVDMSLGASFSTMMVMRDDFVKTIERIRKNKTIRAVVLHIDSPGGSGHASDVIWQKLRELDEEKPLIVSMGSVAGSGGYYIACPGRLIFAQPTTITGSIGVLTILANQASAINRADVNVAEMKRGARSLLGTGHCDMLPKDRDFIQKLILDFYEIFLDRVAMTRKMPKEEVRKVAGGRIYTGRQALEIGLVDRLGGLEDAVAAARDMADIPPSAEIKLVHYPRPASIGDLLFGGGLPMMSMEAMQRAQTPAPRISFDRQLRFFSQVARPLCWMAMPETSLLPAPARPLQSAQELLGLPTGVEPAALPLP